MLEGEENLVEEAKQGNPEAFGQLYDHYLPKIYRFVLIKVAYREQAEDITQQTFFKAWRSMKRYQSKGYPFGSWLYRIARNSVIDHYRKTKEEVDIENVSEEILGVDNTLSQNLDSKFEWETILKSIKSLNDIEQDVLIMRFVEDMQHSEVARVVDKSENAVKVIQHRAIKKLEERLK
ncbi:MAG: hypothetical protein COT88_02235 [Candidatus Colwellbacteria bacterium CG10_big_fil_rev_8_21_14_0_10_41_28]|uniref:RNA polymerase subunit sigma-24 n=1 Tax=Candidatus Colwellbacteria bacterium CG10_big_fil_rev_8_21_14_0_10_41_28 TaxID=1974539 RepID=A0A2H0VJ20_9BACT|nr:MAG: hypothetical protein COT88_02235 [Candidatus Colwellbacteria bacterium CG10_big_fil_rev_8_21_14_0_10_41_28]